MSTASTWPSRWGARRRPTPTCVPTRSLHAAIDTGCDAVHPGYGFLSENADFAQQVIDAGLRWVGPTPAQIRALGDKVEAKRAAVRAGVPTAPIFEASPGVVPADVPMPAIVKAAAGGGGRGMRIVRSRDELVAAIEAGSREALSAFGDGTVFIEPYIERARHVEVQVMGDAHGNVVHLGERECSIQRRNQKIVEEAPSAGISDSVRTALCQGAIALAEHVGYEGAGTVEFLVGADDQINFLEVNTRLQVEHPVTEAVTGLDLVELQLRVAAGDPLPITQDDVTITGHAIEVRVVAEDPSAGWLPSTGTLSSFVVGEGVRVDTGFRTGAVVSPHYDSLLAKVISHAPTRSEAARTLARSLRASEIAGVRTNVHNLVAVLEEPDFLAARTPTAYLEEHPVVVEAAGPGGDDLAALLLGAVFATEARDRCSDAVTGFAPSGWRNLRIHGQRQTWLLDGREHDVEYVMLGDDRADVWFGRWPEPIEDGSLATDERALAPVRLLSRSDDRQVIELDGVRRVINVSFGPDGGVLTSSVVGSVTWRRPPRFADHDLEAEGGGPICPLPGTVIAVHVEVGQQVRDGELLMVVEAMKMEHKITAVGDATVARGALRRRRQSRSG